MANVDGDAKKNAELVKRYDVSGFPTIKFFSKDSKDKPLDYDGGRTEADFVDFLNEKCGTHRAVGGGLNDKVSLDPQYLVVIQMVNRFSLSQAGRLVEFDNLAHQFFVAGADARARLHKQATALAASSSATSKHYLRVMEKLVNGTEGYVEKETERYVTISDTLATLPLSRDFFYRLAAILKKRDLLPSKVDEIKTKMNILRAFVEKKVEVGRAESEL